MNNKKERDNYLKVVEGGIVTYKLIISDASVLLSGIGDTDVEGDVGIRFDDKLKIGDKLYSWIKSLGLLLDIHSELTGVISEDVVEYSYGKKVKKGV